MARSLAKAFRSIQSRSRGKVVQGYALLLEGIFRGDAAALDAFGSMLTYGVGIGIERSLPLAAACYVAASRASYAGAIYNLAAATIEGAGLPKDVREGLRLLRRAHREGVADATNYLGYCYRFGEGVKKDVKRGFRLSLQAARAGAVPAQYDVGICLMTGIGATKDQTAGLSWLSRAARRGELRAIEYLEKHARRVRAARQPQRGKLGSKAKRTKKGQRR
jgi:uncharacterized protein